MSVPRCVSSFSAVTSASSQLAITTAPPSSAESLAAGCFPGAECPIAPCGGQSGFPWPPWSLVNLSNLLPTLPAAPSPCYVPTRGLS
jgi:hypothetical protein